MLHICKSRLFKIILCTSLMCTMCVGEVFGEYHPEATNRNIYKPTGDSVYYYESPWGDNGDFDYYHYPVYNDPMYISDEDFFGVWSEADDGWSTLPYFRYSEFEGLKDVENAVKANNYPLAKEMLLEYYQGQRNNRVADLQAYAASTLDGYEVYLEAMARNAYPNGFLSGEEIGFFMIDNDWKTYSVNVTRVLNQAKGTYSLFNVLVTSVDKYYTEAEIYSKESEYEPVLKVKLKDTNIECPAVKDATIRAGSYADINYGTDEIMTVAEHGTYMSYDDSTKRAYVAFDISAISSTDTIKSASIELRCRTDAPKGEKELSLHWYKNESWEENSVNWDYFSDQLWFSCNDMEAWDYVTSSDATIKGKVCGYQRDSEPSKLYRAYENLGDERYAYQYIRHIMALISGIGFSTDIMNALDMSTHVTSLTQGMYYCIDSQYMTADRFTAMLKHSFTICDWLANSYFGTSTNNTATFASGAVYNLIARFPELVVHNDWFELVKMENGRVLGRGTFDDGMCIELSVNYIKTILDTYETPISTSIDTGEQIPFDDSLYDSIYNTLKTLMNVQGPYSGFNLSDGYDTYGSSLSYFKKWYNYQIFDDSHLTYIVTSGSQGRMPENATTHYPDGLRTYMRSGWGENDLMLAITNNMSTMGSHGHKDALSLAMFAYGSALLTDQGYGSLQTGDAMYYMKSPVQHNLVTVNDIEDYLTEGTTSSYNTLSSGDGKELGFESNMQYDFVEYSTDLYSTSQLNQRSVLFVRSDNFWIVTDYAVPKSPEKENLFAQHWHLYPGAKITYDDNYVIRSNFDGANVKIVPVESNEIDEVRLVDTWYSEAAGQMQDSQKAMILKTKSGAGKFTTILLPMKSGEDIQIESVEIDTGISSDAVNAASFRIADTETNEVNYYYYYHLNDLSLKGEATVGEFTTDATTLLVKKDSQDKILSVFIMDATYLKSNKLENEYVIKSEITIPSLSYNDSGTNLNVASTTLTDEDFQNLTVYSGGAEGVYSLQAEKILNAKKQGGYFYFGENPILDAEDEETSESQEKTEDGRGGAVSGGGGGTGIPAAESFGSQQSVTVNPDVNATDNKSKYSDVGEDEWYYDAIIKLTEKGIVSGDGTGKFYPENDVLREEFLKMMLVAANIELDETENTFTDVKDTDWFKQYVLTGRKIRVVNGISDEEFGIGMKITRQDMVVMISRLPCVKNISGEALETVEFNDNNMISDYAVEAVMKMRKIGLVNGYDNFYRPLDTVTRAEAATVISNLLEILSKE